VEAKLVSLIIFTYNQEEYVREAVVSALSQDYSNLEIIISDDCSADQSFEIIKETVNEYRGPHKIILNQNSPNLGVVKHLNKMIRMSSGELIVGAAGDDISLNNRVRILVNHWQRSKKLMLSSNAIIIDRSGREIGEYSSDKKVELTYEEMVREGGSGVLGATVAWDKHLFERFGFHPEATINEDQLLPFQAALCGGVEYVNENLIKYRVHSQNLSNWIRGSDGSSESLIKGRAAQIKNLINTYKSWEETLAKESLPGDIGSYRVLQALLRKKQNLLKIHLKILHSGGLARFFICWAAIFEIKSLKDVFRTMLLTISPKIYSKILGRKWK